jgi:hypothetical protein
MVILVGYSLSGLDMRCERIANLLCQGGQSSPRSLSKLVEKSGLAKSSVMHLKHLEGQSLVAKQEILQGNERPQAGSEADYEDKECRA